MPGTPYNTPLGARKYAIGPSPFQAEYSLTPLGAVSIQTHSPKPSLQSA